MTLSIPVALRRLVAERAEGRCEYCLLPAAVAFYPHEVDHVIARKHGGETSADNLALSCWRCNRHKGSDLASFDPQTRALVALFHPRTQHWADHFSINEGVLDGRTGEGRTTIQLLQLNTPARVAERLRLSAVGIYQIPAPVGEEKTMAAQEAEAEAVDPLTVGKLIPLAEAAEYAGLTHDTILNYVRRERMKARKMGPIWVTTRAAVDEYLRSRDLESIPKKYRNRT